MPAHDVSPHLFVIFGATGDLNHRKLLPALYHLMEKEGVVGQCYVLGVSRRDLSDEAFRATARESLAVKGYLAENVQRWTDKHLFYQCVGKEPADFEALRARIEALEEKHHLPGNRVFYLSLPPRVFSSTTEALGEVGLNTSSGWTRLVVEKPFGRDLASARSLNELIHRHFDESQVYRIDHYLGKETVQNLLAFRFANMLFESAWNRDRIEHVEITVAESLGLAGRAGYYDKAGALRDMLQNHLTQLFTLIAMEVPSAFEAEAIRQEKIKVLKSVQPIDPERDVVFGQYIMGQVGDERVPGYLQEEGIEGISSTETYAAVRLYVENWRWQGVPFILRAGKRMAKRLTQIAVRFHRAPVSLFKTSGITCDINPNVLLITLQPNEGFDLRFDVKVPGEPFKLKTQQFKFRYESAFGGKLPEAYETLLLDVITGDQTLFVHAEEVEASWALYLPLLENDIPSHPYVAGSWGPKEATRRLVDSWVVGE
ncbi:MAG: glucose-6-phosphate dehydrogenase [Rhodothermales bacterium]